MGIQDASQWQKGMQPSPTTRNGGTHVPLSLQLTMNLRQQSGEVGCIIESFQMRHVFCKVLLGSFPKILSYWSRDRA